MKNTKNSQRASVRSIDWLDALRKIVAAHEWDRERMILTGNFTGSSIAAIKKEAVESAIGALERASNSYSPPSSAVEQQPK